MMTHEQQVKPQNLEMRNLEIGVTLPELTEEEAERVAGGVSVKYTMFLAADTAK